MFFRSLVNWLKQAVIRTAFAELSSELESGGAVATDPPLLTLEVQSTPVEPEKAATTTKAKGRKAAKK
ncbi:hypothetical protein LCGC14_0336580 [marine sediment metagenome]|uniref:Uncharacterized protein n=1 Tax=marine sediment metagenome TaxID=412755 RepID=A0A0F9WMI2_9ZZZZ